MKTGREILDEYNDQFPESEHIITIDSLIDKAMKPALDMLMSLNELLDNDNHIVGGGQIQRDIKSLIKPSK